MIYGMFKVFFFSKPLPPLWKIGRKTLRPLRSSEDFIDLFDTLPPGSDEIVALTEVLEKVKERGFRFFFFFFWEVIVYSYLFS